MSCFSPRDYPTMRIGCWPRTLCSTPARPLSRLPYSQCGGRSRRCPGKKARSACCKICAIVSAAAIVAMLWISPAGLSRATAYNAAIFLVLGAAATLRRRTTPRAVFLPSLAIVAALCGATLVMLPRQASGWLSNLAAHLILLMVLCTFPLFARFRLADRFIRYTVRILLAALWAGLLAGITTAPTPWQVLHQAHFPGAIHAFLLVLSVNALLVSITFVDERVTKQVNRWLFRAPDYRAETRGLAAKLRDLEDEAQIAAAVEEAARRPLELSEARVVALDLAASPPWPAALLEGETVERGGEVLIPIAVGGHFSYLLLASPGPARPGLVSGWQANLETSGPICPLLTSSTRCTRRFTARSPKVRSFPERSSRRRTPVRSSGRARQPPPRARTAIRGLPRKSIPW